MGEPGSPRNQPVYQEFAGVPSLTRCQCIIFPRLLENSFSEKSTPATACAPKQIRADALSELMIRSNSSDSAVFGAC